ncbi:MAG: carboxylating nicotinate-nucleotide diphosphorylase [Actinobacteria bacterium]|nr:carboxylating nicotinate-nucleotide diphosphorylase [Actinomycetota bacterium]
MTTHFHQISPELDSYLHARGLPPAYVEEIIRGAVLEDLDGGIDITTHSTVSADLRSEVQFTSRAPGCIAGMPILAAVLEMMCGENNLTGLNLLCHLSGIATATRNWANQLAGTNAAVRDTRKTTPGLRKLEKYAVRCGGGQNHRMSLSDAALVKDNHIAAAGGVAAAFQAVREHAPDITVEIEVDTLDQLREALGAGADLVLLDNMEPSVLREAVAIAQEHTARTGKKVLLEASGGLTLATAGAVGATGVDFISVGGLTHSSPILDIGLDYLRTL